MNPNCYVDAMIGHELTIYTTIPMFNNDFIDLHNIPIPMM